MFSQWKWVHHWDCRCDPPLWQSLGEDHIHNHQSWKTRYHPWIHLAWGEQPRDWLANLKGVHESLPKQVSYVSSRTSRGAESLSEVCEGHLNLQDGTHPYLLGRWAQVWFRFGDSRPEVSPWLRCLEPWVWNDLCKPDNIPEIGRVLLPNLATSQQAICASVITYFTNILITPRYSFVSIYTLCSCFPIVSSHLQSLTPFPCSVLFSPSHIKPHIMYSSSSVWNQTKLHIIYKFITSQRIIS